MISLLLAAVIAAATTCDKITIRKEVHDVTPQEWQIFASTLRLAQKTPDPSNKNLSIWEAAADLHARGRDMDIHTSCQFAFWHRYFVNEMERKLQKLHPKFFFPYWESSREWNAIDKSIVWNHIGRSGIPVEGGGVFGSTLLYFNGSRKYPLFRNFKTFGNLHGLEIYDSLFQDSLKNGGYDYWNQNVFIIHASMHERANGMMSTSSSPLDPLFYLHHGYVDFLWTQSAAGWKQKGLDTKAQFAPNCTASSKLWHYNVTLGDIVDTSQLCVKYALLGSSIVENSAVRVTGSNSTVKILHAPRNSTRANTTATSHVIVTHDNSPLRTKAQSLMPQEPQNLMPESDSEGGNAGELEILKYMPNDEKPEAKEDQREADPEQDSNEDSESNPDNEDVSEISKAKSESTPKDTSVTNGETDPESVKDAEDVSEISKARSESTPKDTSVTNGETDAESVKDPKKDESGQNPAIIKPFGSFRRQRQEASKEASVVAVDTIKKYKPIDSCPPPLKESWLIMQGMSREKAKKMIEESIARCDKVLNKISAGQSIPEMPRYKEKDRPKVSVKKDKEKYTYAEPLKVAMPPNDNLGDLKNASFSRNLSWMICLTLIAII